MDFHALMKTEAYDFLRTNERLGSRIMLLGLGGSYAYGTNNEGSDIDFRGVTLMLPSDLLGLTEFEQYEDDGTDTVIYGFNKLVKLLLEKKEVKGSTGILAIRDGNLLFIPNGSETPAASRPLIYEKKN